MPTSLYLIVKKAKNDSEKVILRYAKLAAKNRYHAGWERLGRELSAIKRIAEDSLHALDLNYQNKCKAKDKIRDDVDAVYDSYFKCTPSMWDHIHGNSMWKELLKNISDKKTKKSVK